MNSVLLFHDANFVLLSTIPIDDATLCHVSNAPLYNAITLCKILFLFHPTPGDGYSIPIDPLSSKLPRRPQFLGCLFRNAPTAPRYPSCRRKYAFFSPLLQNLIAYDRVFIVWRWPRMKDPPKEIVLSECFSDCK